MNNNHTFLSLMNKLATFMMDKYNITKPESVMWLIKQASKFEECPSWVKGLEDVCKGKSSEQIKELYINKYDRMFTPYVSKWLEQISKLHDEMVQKGNNLQKVILSYYENPSPELKETIIEGIKKFFLHPEAYRYYGKFLFNEVYQDPDMLDRRPLPDRKTYDELLSNTWAKAKQCKELNDDTVEVFLNLVHYANVLLMYNYTNSFYKACAGARLTAKGIELEKDNK